MGREERKLKKHLQQRENTELRKFAQKNKGTRDPRDPLPLTNCATGLVIASGPRSCVVRLDGLDTRCRSQVDVAVGDRVRFSAEMNRVESVLPRATVLSRPDPHNPRIPLVIAANIDVVVNVVSLLSPPLRLGLIDRYLVAIERAGARPLICVNKIDLLDRRDAFQPYLDMGVPVVFCSAASNIGLDELRAALAGKMSVLTGHSGVGKSSLLNALDPAQTAATGDVGAVHKKGRHTTTSSRLYDMPDGGIVIDTPGIRELGLWDVSSADVRLYFHDFDQFAHECAFSDCSHTHEPRCAVKAALASGGLLQARYDSYLRIMTSTAAGAVPP